MKKLVLFLFAAFLLLGITACNGNRTYKADGDFMAIEISEHNGAPMITTVTVTIKDDKITKFDINALQSDGTTFAWNAKDKKALGYEYGMHKYTYIASLGDGEEYTLAGYKAWLTANDKLDWHEQAELIEAYWLANGFDSVTTTGDDKVIDNVANVTIKDGGYTKLAAEAVQQAKDGLLKAYEASMSYGKPQVTWVEVNLDDKGKVDEITIDALQSSITEGVFAWNAKTKQELGYDYKMHYGAYTGSLGKDATPTMAGYKTWLTDNEKLEWFEQVKVITDYVVANGWVDSFKVTDMDDAASVTVTTDSYTALLKEVFAKLA